VFEISSMTGQDVSPPAMTALVARLRETARREDRLAQLAPGRYALALPGFGPFQAQALAERIVNDLSPISGSGEPMPGTDCLLRAGVADMPEGDDPETNAVNVLTEACEALEGSSASPGAAVHERVRLFRRKTVPLEHDTLVLPSEKQFLFFGVS